MLRPRGTGRRWGFEIGIESWACLKQWSLLIVLLVGLRCGRKVLLRLVAMSRCARNGFEVA